MHDLDRLQYRVQFKINFMQKQTIFKTSSIFIQFAWKNWIFVLLWVTTFLVEFNSSFFQISPRSPSVSIRLRVKVTLILRMPLTPPLKQVLQLLVRVNLQVDPATYFIPKMSRRPVLEYHLEGASENMRSSLTVSAPPSHG